MDALSSSREQPIPITRVVNAEKTNSTKEVQNSTIAVDTHSPTSSGNSRRNKRYLCAVCLKSFAWKKHLKRHMLNHDEAKHRCRHCAKSFYRKECLIRHETICKERKNECSFCNCLLSNRSNLKRHLKVCEIKYREKEIKEASKEYREKLRIWTQIQQILRKCPDTLEEALNMSDRQCLKIYQSSFQDVLDVNNINLKPWQREVIQFIDRPSERLIY